MQVELSQVQPFQNFLILQAPQVELNSVLVHKVISAMKNPLQNHHFILSTVANDRRQKIAQFFQDELEKKMTPRVSIEAQQLKCMHENLELKRKCSKKDEKTEKEMLSKTRNAEPLKSNY